MEEWTGRMRYAIAFDLDTDKLKTLYGSPYNNAYVEIKKVLEQFNSNFFVNFTYITFYRKNKNIRFFGKYREVFFKKNYT